MRCLLPLALLLVACDGFPPPDIVEPGGLLPEARCRAGLDLEDGAVLGHVVGGEFESLAEGSPLRVHAGGQGGYHSDLVLRLTGPDARIEATDALDLDVVVSGGWTEGRTANLVSDCRSFGEPGYYATVRLIWNGPPRDDEGDDEWDDWEEGPSIGWSELTSYTAEFTTTVVLGGEELVFFDDVELTRGEMDDEGGG